MSKKKFYKVQLDAETIVCPLKMDKKEFTLGELAEGYYDNSEKITGGVVAMSGKLCVRPPYQRSYVVYNDDYWKSRLIHSVLNHRPIGVMYFGVVENRTDGFKYNNIDGQQRIKTLCDFINGDLVITFSHNGELKTGTFSALPKLWQEQIKNYKVEVYICRGSEQEQIEWFKTINQPSSILTKQEVLNSGFSGYVWLEKAKEYFSSSSASNAKKDINHPASDYCMAKYATFSEGNGDGTRQECLEKAIEWACYGTECMDFEDPIEAYMSLHCKDENADELINHYKKVVDWVRDVFFHDGDPKSWQSVRSQDWGRIYNDYKDMELTDEQKDYISKRTKEIVGYGAAIYNKSDGIYEWVLRGEKDDEVNTYLHLRGFTAEDKDARFNAQGGIDPIDGQQYDREDMHAHHIKPWRGGGDSKYDNLVWLSKENHRKLHAGEFGISPEELRRLRDELCNRQAGK